jgi:hypothetical protein
MISSKLESSLIFYLESLRLTLYVFDITRGRGSDFRPYQISAMRTCELYCGHIPVAT